MKPLCSKRILQSGFMIFLLEKENHQLSWWRLKLKLYTEILLCYIEKDLAVAQCNDRRIYHYEK